MTSFAILVLGIMILEAIFYLITALYSFGVKTPKWLRITTGVFFILCFVFAVLGFVMMKDLSFTGGTSVLHFVNLILGIYMLASTKAPKRLKIVFGVIACILFVMYIVSCIAVPSMYGSITLDMGLNGL